MKKKGVGLHVHYVSQERDWIITGWYEHEKITKCVGKARTFDAALKQAVKYYDEVYPEPLHR